MRRGWLWLSATALWFACGGDETTPAGGPNAASAGPGGGADTRYRPQPNGAAMSARDACQKMRAAISGGLQNDGCVGTLRDCPALLQLLYGSPCSYDAGTVAGCVQFFGQQTDCAQLSVDRCVLVAIGTAAMGC